MSYFDGADLLDRSVDLSKLSGNALAMMMGLPPTIKDLWWVDHTAPGRGDRQGKGTHPRTPFDTVAYAVAHCQKAGTALTDIGIIVLPGHTETIIAANGWDFAAAGIYVKGLGWGSRRPTITLGTSTAAQVLLDQDASVIDNMIFVNDIASTVAMIAVSGDDCRILNNRIQMDVSDKNALIGILIGVAGTDNLEIAGNQIESDTAGANSGIKVAEVVSRCKIHNNDIDGDFADAAIHNPTGKTATRARILNNILINTQTGDHALELVSAVTGVIGHNNFGTDMADATPDGLDGGACYMFENYGHDAGGNDSGLLNPAADS